MITLLVLLLGLVVTPRPAKAESCSYPTFQVYPGSAISMVRYAEVDFHFEV
ncbi:hypothetical protein AB1460_29235 [Parafrankia sp. FMc2]